MRRDVRLDIGQAGALSSAPVKDEPIEVSGHWIVPVHRVTRGPQRGHPLVEIGRFTRKTGAGVGSLKEARPAPASSASPKPTTSLAIITEQL